MASASPRLLALLCLSALLVSSLQAEPTRTIQAESYSVGRLTSGAPTSTQLDARAEGREWVKFTAAKDGDWIQLIVPGLLPGRYSVKLRQTASADAAAGVFEIGAADGTQFKKVGEFSPQADNGRGHWTAHVTGYTFGSAAVGEVVLTRPGFYAFRFSAKKAGVIGIDSMALESLPDVKLSAPAGAEITATGSIHAEVRWQPVPGATGYFIERSGPPDLGWGLAGYVPGSAQRYVATGLFPNSDYQLRVTAFSEQGTGPASASASTHTQLAWSKPRATVIQNKTARAGEGSVVKLKDGRLLMYYNVQTAVADFAVFDIYQTESSDGGRTWSPGKPMLTDPTKKLGYFMPSMLRLDDGRLGFIYAERSQADLVSHRYFCFSSDEAATWSKPIKITSDLPVSDDGRIYTGATGPHDRLIQLANGDLMIPFHLSTGLADTELDKFNDRSGFLLVFSTVVYKSSDRGATWQRVFGPQSLKGTNQGTPYPYHWFDEVLSEPSLVEISPGRLLLQMRCQAGFFYQARSEDGGKTWSEIHQSPVRAAITPSKLINVSPGIIGVVFDPWVNPTEGNMGRRFALGSMISRDGGETWENFKILDMADPATGNYNFCYPYFYRDGTDLHAFYFGPRGNTMSYQRLPATWFTDVQR